jgi:hypothetical protein
VPTEWHSSSNLIRSNFRALYTDKEIGAVFDTEYVKALTARRIEKINTVNKLLVFSLTLTAFMAAWLLVDDLKFTLLGLTVDRVDRLIEFVRVLSSLIGLYVCVIILENRQALDVLEVISQERSPEAAAYYKMSLVSHAEGLIGVAPSPQQHVYQSKTLKSILTIWSVLFVGAIVLAAGTAFGINVIVAWSMFEHPAIGPVASRVLAIFALLCDLVSWTMVWFTFGRLPMANFTDVVETQPILEREGAAAWGAEMEARRARRAAATAVLKAKGKAR